MVKSKSCFYKRNYVCEIVTTGKKKDRKDKRKAIGEDSGQFSPTGTAENQ
jgi:hypothetical protein